MGGACASAPPGGWVAATQSAPGHLLRSATTPPVLGSVGERGLVLGDAGQVSVDVGGAGVVGGDGEMRGADLPPAIRVGPPAVGVAARVLRLSLHAEAVRGSPDLLAVGPDRVELFPGAVVGAPEGHEAVA